MSLASALTVTQRGSVTCDQVGAGSSLTKIGDEEWVLAGHRCRLRLRRWKRAIYGRDSTAVGR
jgi:hypothetical protein